MSKLWRVYEEKGGISFVAGFDSIWRRFRTCYAFLSKLEFGGGRVRGLYVRTWGLLLCIEARNSVSFFCFFVQLVWQIIYRYVSLVRMSMIMCEALPLLLLSDMFRNVKYVRLCIGCTTTWGHPWIKQGQYFFYTSGGPQRLLCTTYSFVAVRSPRSCRLEMLSENHAMLAVFGSECRAIFSTIL